MPDSPPPDDVLDSIKACLYRGDKIGAIKTYREHARVDLKGAKEAVEELETQLRAATPEKFSRAAGKGGCAGVLVAVLTLGVVTAWGAVKMLGA